MTHETDLLSHIKTRLTQTQSLADTSDFDLNHGSNLAKNSHPLHPAGVIVPLIKRHNHWHIILTKRSHRLRHHPGQIAFPGGKVNKKDTCVRSAAIREAHEEIGLMPRQIEILGSLPRHNTVTNFCISPFVARIDQKYTPMLETNEVDYIFYIPLKFALNHSHYQIQHQIWHNQMRRYFTLPYGPYYIWGATARILYLFAQVVCYAPPHYK